MRGLCEVPLRNEEEVDNEFCVGDSAFYKAESKVPPATVTAVTDHADIARLTISNWEMGWSFLRLPNPCFPSTPPPILHIPLQIGGDVDLVKRKQCRAIVWIGVSMLASWQQKLLRNCLPCETDSIWQSPLAESQPHLWGGNHTVGKLMGV